MHTTRSSLNRLLGTALALTAPLALASCGELQDNSGEQQGAITSSHITRVYSGTNNGGTNNFGAHQTVTNGSTDPNNPFFQSIGTNGRSCLSCHQPAQAWGITPAEVSQRFNNTGGTDPIFRLNDGANAPNLPVGTFARRQTAYSLLVNRGTIRVGIGLPASREFELTLVEDPYHFATAGELSLFRRPLPSTNLKFLSAVMWDGREGAVANDTALIANLGKQANDATRGHAQAARDLTTGTGSETEALVNFELALFTAQITDNNAGSLIGQKATPTGPGLPAMGGPSNLRNQDFFIGINDPLGQNPRGTTFTNHVFSIYDNWSGSLNTAQASIARGQNIFNTRVIHITGVRGVNDVVGVADLPGGCVTCHDSPNVGNHSVALPLDLGLTDPNTFNTDTTPRYTLTNKTTGAVLKTSDPGRALIDGKWAHVATFKGPILRGLASRKPYFHNGFAADLPAVVKFYDTRFHMGLTIQDTQDLVNFLATL